MSGSAIPIAPAEIETTAGPSQPSQTSPGDRLQSRESRNWRKSNIVATWYYLNAVGFALFAVAFASSLCTLTYASWVTGMRCSEARLPNGTAEVESSIMVYLWSYCNVHLVDNGRSVIKYSKCSTWDAEMMPVWYHGVQLAMAINMLSMTICLFLLAFLWFCCRHNERSLFGSVCLSAVCSVVAQSIGLGCFVAGDKSSLFSRLTDAVDGRSCADYRFSGHGSALILSVLSLTTSVVVTLLQAPISWMRSIIDASRVYNRLLSPSSGERTPLLRSATPILHPAENGS